NAVTVPFRELATRIEGKKIRTYPVIVRVRGPDACFQRGSDEGAGTPPDGNSTAPRGRECPLQRGLRGRGRRLGFGPGKGRIQPLQLGRRLLGTANFRSEEHTSELQSRSDLVCRL